MFFFVCLCVCVYFVCVSVCVFCENVCMLTRIAVWKAEDRNNSSFFAISAIQVTVMDG